MCAPPNRHGIANVRVQMRNATRKRDEWERKRGKREMGEKRERKKG